VSCFNVNPEFARNFKFMKSRGGDEFKILYMEAAFNKETGSGEFFMEFADKVRENKLVGSFKSQGAGQVVPVTFPHNDGDSSAVDALVRILAQQDDTGYSYTRGVLPDTLKNKIEAKKKAAAQQALLSSREFDEKTAAALKASLDGHTVKLELLEDGMHAIGDCMESQKVKLEAMEGGMEFQKVKLEAMEGGIVSQKVDIVDIKQGVCNVIPDYQNEIRNLKEALVRKTAACDTIEGKLGHKTRVINQQDAYIVKLEEDQKLHFQEKQAWSSEKTSLLMKNSSLQEELNQIRALKLILEKVDHIAEILSSTLAEERAGKRPREA
jgi:hypothetical protein